jgi:GTP-binding protein Era
MVNEIDSDKNNLERDTIPQKCGFIAVIGAPNVGKSTLVNYLVGAKVTIVSPKVQTTRNRVMGVTIIPETHSQIVFIDTPGIFTPKRRLERAMVHAAWSGVKDADFLLVLIDSARGFTDDSLSLVTQLKNQNHRAIIALNKIDLIDKDKLLGLAAQCEAFGIFDQVFMVSAKKGYGTKDLLTYFSEKIPLSPWHFPEDQLSDIPMRLLAAEITREQIFIRLHDELPYSILVETESWEERQDGSVRIDQIIYVHRDSQKSIVLGHSGQQIRELGSRSRRELMTLFERPVHLFLHVKVRSQWLEERQRYQDMGLDFDV